MKSSTNKNLNGKNHQQTEERISRFEDKVEELVYPDSNK
jgi:hypothetical protein